MIDFRKDLVNAVGVSADTVGQPLMQIEETSQAKNGFDGIFGNFPTLRKKTAFVIYLESQQYRSYGSRASTNMISLRVLVLEDLTVGNVVTSMCEADPGAAHCVLPT
ncbi:MULTISPECIES: hypothetical protein [unclassified Pseudomonas]|uniref:hypothetical protein n=1 Tax=unclassified Pseudomonas TaxID=196821 RepID=UPI0015A1F9CA|nr:MULTISPECIES: hypothetical protein [unclassified Pseudomonas]NWC96060.1 hypothetical protein [Pseudomonas sp. IPO3779]NWD21019.1 hypothetical protein [Pseudomonas sp. IPO3778]